MKTFYENSRGFALIEIILVVAIIGSVLGFGAVADLSAFKGDSFRAEQNKIISVLERARSRSMSNMFDTTHGVCFISPNYIIFKGNVCGAEGTTEYTIAANTNITITFPPSPVIFERLTGNATDAAIHITDGIKTADITINNEGRIDW